ncbi:MAG: class I SAM-dependent methyltransferase [Balneolaceae bacterium]|nr:MAG: class I SAM-dependent methyltransferase [Balneolaceae bacterium]
MMSNNSEKLVLHRPGVIVPETDPEPASKKSDMEPLSASLLAGRFVLIRDEFATGLAILSRLREHVFGSRKGGTDDFQSYRSKRAAYRDASNRLLVPVEGNRIALKKAPAIGWLDELYPDMSDFLLPFPQVQGLNSSWQWFLKGVRFPVLKHEIYPWYGTYFPTRFDHLFLFDKWLKQYSGNRTAAMDIGTGCGVLAFMLLERGFEHVLAADINPNAVMTVRENARHRGLQDRIGALVSNLFESAIFDGYDHRADLIVCNPPWLPSDPDSETSLLDNAIYYDPDFFKRFFSEAGSYLNQNGRLIVLFSNLGRTSGMDTGHPVEEELENKQRYRKVRMMRRNVAAPSVKTRRRDHRKDEFVELWELEAQHENPG